MLRFTLNCYMGLSTSESQDMTITFSLKIAAIVCSIAKKPPNWRVVKSTLWFTKELGKKVPEVFFFALRGEKMM